MRVSYGLSSQYTYWGEISPASHNAPNPDYGATVITPFNCNHLLKALSHSGIVLQRVSWGWQVGGSRHSLVRSLKNINYDQFYFAQFPRKTCHGSSIVICCPGHIFERRKLSFWLGITENQILHFKFKCSDGKNFPQTDFGLCTFQTSFHPCSQSAYYQAL